MQQECNTNNTSVTQMRDERHNCDKSATWKTRVRYDWKILILITTPVKKFSHPYIYYMARERQQGEEQFHTKN